jgi:hypothetical protein
MVSKNLNNSTLIVELLAFSLFIVRKGIEEVERRAIYVHIWTGEKSVLKEWAVAREEWNRQLEATVG